MNTFISGFLSNDSFFGRMMNKAWIIIASNLMFLFFSIPIVTIGPSLVALYHVMLRCVRTNGDINPFKEFWKGFKSNFKQAIIFWILALLLALCLYYDIEICNMAGGILTICKYGLYAMSFFGAIIFLFTLPTMAAFADTIIHLMRNAFYFAAKKPVKLLVILFFDIFPMYLTITDPTFLPLYVFCWFFFGFGAIAMIGASLLFPEFKPFLDKDHQEDKLIDEDKQALEDLMKLDGM